MKRKLFKVLTATALALLPVLSFGQAPTLGTAANFVLFTTIGPVTNSGTSHLTHLTGNVGTNAGSSTGFGNVDGQMHDGGVTSAAAAADVISLFGQLTAATPTVFPLSTLLGNGDTLVAGVYQYPLLTAASLNLNLILDAEGDPNALFIIKIDGAFSTSANAKVILANGALACNVFWLVEGMINVGAGTTIRGTMLAHNAAIDMGALDTLEGRALSMNGAITMNSLMAYTPLGCGSPFLTGPAAPPLESTAAFGVFSSIGPVTSTPVTFINGHVGSNTAGPTGFDPLNVTGTIYGPGLVTAAAAADLTDVYNYMNALPTDIELLHPDLFGHDLVLTPHTYHMAGGPIALTGSVYLNAQGNPNAVFVINMNGAFTTSTLSRVMLINGTQAKNVYWKIDGATHIYDNSLFNGTIIGAGAITLNTGNLLNGSAMTINGAVAINASTINITPAACVASTITGEDSVCVGMTTLLTSSDTGRIWHSSNESVATVDSVSGLVTGVSPGTTIITLTTGLACQNTDTITVLAAPLPITAIDSVVCVGSSVTYTNLSPAGTWSSSNSLIAEVGSLTGIFSGIAIGTANISYTIEGGCSAVKSVTVNVGADAGTITGTLTTCPGGTTNLSNTTPGGTWSSVTPATATIGSFTGIVTGVAMGTTTISYTVTDGCGTNAATAIVTVNAAPDAGSITGDATTCPAGTTTLSNAVAGGTWTSGTPTTATIGSATGIVTGVALGTTTISYTVSNSCGIAAATIVVTVNSSATAGTITGTATTCAPGTTTLSNAIPGGVWTSGTPANATIGSSSGIVTGVTAGTTEITYTVTNSCGTAATTRVVTVNPAPNAGTITGIATTCPAGTTTLSNATGGGEWSSVTPTTAIIGSASGIVTGVSAGTTTISYTVTNVCGTAAATIVVTVSATPNAGTITGLTTLCEGNTTTLANTAGGGVWTSSNTSTASIGSSTGFVSALAAGTTTISYTVTNSCGTAVTTQEVTVNPLPNAGTVSGTTSVCAGNSTMLSSTAGGGIWTSANTAIATVNPATGNATGVSAGITTISYSVINSCGTDVATTTFTVNPLPNAGAITGLTTLCEGNTTTLTNTASGGEWTSSNTSTASIGSSTGFVSALAAGTTTISYTVTNSCGTAVTTQGMTVNPLPNAGTLSGTSSVCPGNSTMLSSTAGGGIWTSANTAIATVNTTTGNVTGVSTGTVAISYSVTNSCGTAVATRTVTVNPLPNAGTIIGMTTLCAGNTTTLSNAAGGGVWTSSTTTTATVGSTTGIVSAIAAGTTTITYTVVNSCGTDIATQTMTVNPLPVAGAITGTASVCAGNSTMLSNTSGGGIWTSANNSIATVNAITGNVSGVNAGIVTISYSVTNGCGTAVATRTVTVNPQPNAGTINGATRVCVGNVITLTNSTTGGTWSASNGTATVSAGMVIGVVAGIDTIIYSVSNSCGSATAIKIVTINPLPAIATITTQAPATICVGAMYQNFGASTPAAANSVYNWSAANATVWAQGAAHNYALINFHNAGTAQVTLNTTISATGCTSKSTVAITVSEAPAQVDYVSYFKGHFVCTPNGRDSYQWGYDNASTLDSTILTGEINQDYVNANPDFGNKFFWVMTTEGGCQQKTYYRAPLAVENINDEVATVNVFPNPATSQLNVEISSVARGTIEVEIMNVMGQKISTVTAERNKALVDVTNLAAGTYIVTCYNDGTRISSTRFTKN